MCINNHQHQKQSIIYSTPNMMIKAHNAVMVHIFPIKSHRYKLLSNFILPSLFTILLLHNIEQLQYNNRIQQIMYINTTQIEKTMKTNKFIKITMRQIFKIIIIMTIIIMVIIHIESFNKNTNTYSHNCNNQIN